MRRPPLRRRAPGPRAAALRRARHAVAAPAARRLAPIAVIAALAGGGLLWARDTSLLEVREVAVSGATGPDAPRIVAALEAAALDMTTLHVREDALREAVASFPTVADVETDADLPHGLRIVVVERRPVARVSVGGRQVPLAADGTLLHGAAADGELPVLAVDAAPGSRIDDPAGRALVAVAAAVPAPLRARAGRLARGRLGLEVAMEEGPTIVFGAGDRIAAKWAAAARVLADPAAQGARSVDVRVPERPAAGGLPPLVEPEPSGQPSTSGTA